MTTIDETWNETTNVYEENSMSVTRTAREVTLTFNVGVREQADDGRQRGWFEWYSDDEEWYCSGGLWFRNGELTDYDGCFSLCSQVIRKLHEHGFDVKEIAQTCAPSLHKELFDKEYRAGLHELNADNPAYDGSFAPTEGEEE